MTAEQPELSFGAKHLLAWKAGLTFVEPWPGDLRELREKGLVGDGDMISARITDAGRKALEAPS